MLTTSKLDDKMIREAVLAHLYRESTQSKETGEIVVIEELDLCLGQARIDLAVINGIATGIEIKSDKDSLDRLESQIETYSKIFDFVEIVVGSKHLESVLKNTPQWCGVSLVLGGNSDELIYKKIRSTKLNKRKDPFSALQLLWKNEALQLLETANVFSSFKNKSRDIIWKQLLESFKSEDLFRYVNQCLKNRQNWRFVHLLK